MKIIFIGLFTLLLAGCDYGSVIDYSQGKKFSEYVELCTANPENELCSVEELDAQKTSELNARWCEMCEETNDSYEWCAFLPCRLALIPGLVPQEIPAITETSEPIRGRPIRGTANAYEEMCARNPGSPLCPEDN
jgi:hypothetical protein